MEATVALNAAGDLVEAVVQLPPGVASATDVEVEVVGDETLLVQCPGCGPPLQLALPIPVDPDTGKVRFKRATSKLTFTAAARRPSSLRVPPPAPTAAPTAAASPPRATGSPGVTGASQPPPASPPAPASSQPQADTPGEAAAATPAPACSETPAAPNPRDLSAGPPVATRPPGAAAPTAAASPTPPQPSPPQTPTSPAPSTAPNASSGPQTGHQANGGAAVPVPQANGQGAAAPGAPQPADPPPAASADAGPRHPPSRPPALGPTPVASALTAAPGGGGPDNDDAALYRDFYCDSPPAMAARPPAPPHTAAPKASSGSSASSSSSSSSSSCAETPSPTPSTPSAAADAGGGGGANAGRVAAAFTSTCGTSGRDAGFSFTAPELPPPPPLPAGLPPVAAPIDCRYLATANALRVSAHASTAALAEAMGLRRRASAAAERRKTERMNEIVQRVADTLDAYGYAVLDNFGSEASVKAARQELSVMEPHYSPGMIWVGKEAETGAQISVSAVRGDVVLWLDDPALNATAFVKDGVRRSCSFMQLQQLLADVDELVFEGLRPRLPYLAGLHRRSDAMMAVYPGKGARFARHVDNTTLDGRRLTVVTYLNPGWQEAQGGALRLFPLRQGTTPVVDVLPLSGRVAMFLSAEVAHEVLPAFAPRHAVTLWYFDAGEHAAALTAAKVMPGASSRPAAQAAATALLRDLLADEAASDIQATPEGCAKLGTRVASLDLGAKQLLAAVLGMPSVTALVESMRSLTPDSLRQRREELRNMGLGAQHHAPDTSAHV